MFRHAAKCGAQLFDGVKVESIEFSGSRASMSQKILKLLISIVRSPQHGNARRMVPQAPSNLGILLTQVDERD